MQTRQTRLATALLNGQLRNSAGENLGKIEDFVIDPETGAIQYAIVSLGGELRTGDKLFAIPWSCLSFYARLGSSKTRHEGHNSKCGLCRERNF